MTRRCWAAVCSLLFLAVQPATGHAAVTEDMFQMRDTSDLVGLCSAGQGDPLYVAAIHFCQGFGSGAYGVASEYEGARSRARMFCPPSADRRPSRNAAVAEFVQWANARPDVMRLPVTDGLLRFLSDRFPCPEAAVAKGSRR